MVSVIIPSRNEQPYLEKTVANVLANASGKIEVLVVLDGWLPSPQIVIPDGAGKVIWIHNEEAKGQRASINAAARIARGDYIMKLDAHCAVGKGFDEILVRDCEYDMTMIPAMFNLDVLTWQPKYFGDWDQASRKGKLNPYMYIGLKDNNLRACYYGGKERKRIFNEGKTRPVDETMCCMGPAFFLHKKRFWELDGCDEGHGQWGQQGVEVACKAWLSGGRLMTNKNTWFAHFFRGGGVPEGHKSGFPYPLSQRAINRARAYSNDLWMNDKWPKQKRKFQWLIDKFNPPGWEGKRGRVEEKKLTRRIQLVEMFRDLGFKKGAEIGVARGEFSKQMHETIPDLELLSVDNYLPRQISQRRRMKQYVAAKKALSRYPGNTMVREESLVAAMKVPDGSLDFVYIDADHTFNGVVCDIVLWAQKVRRGGVVAGHDYIAGRKTYGVIDAVDMYCKHNRVNLHLTERGDKKYQSKAPSWYFFKK